MYCYKILHHFEVQLPTIDFPPYDSMTPYLLSILSLTFTWYLYSVFDSLHSVFYSTSVLLFHVMLHQSGIIVLKSRQNFIKGQTGIIHVLFRFRDKRVLINALTHSSCTDMTEQVGALKSPVWSPQGNSKTGQIGLNKKIWLKIKCIDKSWLFIAHFCIIKNK